MIGFRYLRGSLTAAVLVVAGGFVASAAADESLKDVACRSVHWGYDTPAATLFYLEATIARTAPGTYFCVCGFNQGYYGLQELGDGRRLLIFSVWDPTSGDDPNAVKPEDRVRLLYRDAAVRVGRFGGEGTGGQSFFDYAWKNDATYRLLVGARVDGAWTEYAAWFFEPETARWRHLATFAARTGGKPLGGGYSFVEDFRRNGESARQTRSAQFGPGWIMKSDGAWQPVAAGRFTADANPALTINAAVRRGRFFLATGGDTAGDDLPLGTRVELPVDAARRPPDDVVELVPRLFTPATAASASPPQTEP